MGDWRWRGDRVGLEVLLCPGRDGEFKDILKGKMLKDLMILSHIGPIALLGND